MLEVFPDAQFLMVHRDPRESVPSCTSMIYRIEQMMTVNRNAHFHAQQENWHHARCVAEQTKQREQAIYERSKVKLPVENLFIDLSYRDLVADTMGTLQKLYKKLDMNFTEDTQTAMLEWLKNNRQYKHGRHNYSLAQFALTEEDIKQAWGEYEEQYRDYL